MSAISTPTVTINNQVIAVLPNSVSFDEGKGEQTVTTLSAGGSIVQQVYADNAETKLSMVKFALRNLADQIELARIWKSNGNANSISITAPGFSRQFQYMALTNNYEVTLAADGKLELEFKGSSAV